MAEIGPFVDGQMYALSCLGEFQTHPERLFFLDGRTGDGSVALAPRATEEFSGTKWKAFVTGDRVLLECQGDVDGPRFLNGFTGDQSVHLAPTGGGASTSTVWRVVLIDTHIALKCLSEDNPHLFLDGVTQSNTVRLSNTTEDAFTGTHWAALDFGNP